MLKDALSFIEENIASLNLREVSDFLTFNSTLSPYFVQEVTELAKSDLNSADLQNIRSRFVGERDRLAALYNDVLARKKTSEKQLLDYLASQRNLENLDVDLLAQSVFMDSIKRGIQSVSFESELELLDSEKIYSKAIAPIYPSFPKPKIIFLVNFVLFLLLSFIFIYVHQSIYKVILSFEQFKRLYPKTLAFNFHKRANELKKKLFSSSPGFELSDVDFFKTMSEAGKFIYILDIDSVKSKNLNSSSLISIYISRWLSQNKKTVMVSGEGNEYMAGLSRKKIYGNNLDDAGLEVVRLTGQSITLANPLPGEDQLAFWEKLINKVINMTM